MAAPVPAASPTRSLAGAIRGPRHSPFPRGSDRFGGGSGRQSRRRPRPPAPRGCAAPPGTWRSAGRTGRDRASIAPMVEEDTREPAICCARAAAPRRVSGRRSIRRRLTAIACRAVERTSSRGSPARLVPWLMVSASAATRATGMPPPRRGRARRCVGRHGRRVLVGRGRPQPAGERERRAVWPSLTGGVVIAPEGAAIPPSARSQPASNVSATGNGGGKLPATRNTANPSIISAPAPPNLSETQVNGSPNSSSASHNAAGHFALLGGVDRLRLAQIGEDPRSRVNDQKTRCP